ncbi:hypothetical protein [Halomarina oriensis]|uniref:Uncharacterized protein n=1 Tax=Halomarina oriensis TaxID=671145 RepID=A0A6B0GNX8_9EURY|nr:hypothetical protein [Halomarina oriensis]MWG36512.1 hypothetical protein [Halomarina oriensis]
MSDNFAQRLNRREEIDVRVDGKELLVYNWVNVIQPTEVRGHNPVVATAGADIYAGDSTMKPDAVTHWVAKELDDELRIDPADHGIEVIDVTDDEVTVL